MEIDKVYQVLFICTSNSARSIMAEGLLNGLAKGRFRACSAGSDPAPQVHPLALSTLQHMSLPSSGLRSKSWDEFAKPDAPRLDFIFTVCDAAAGEACPVWPGHPISAHWGVADPESVQGEEQRRKAFHDTAVALRRRIDLLLALPIQKLDALSLRNELQDIGGR